jgi:hypothetical protein
MATHGNGRVLVEQQGTQSPEAVIGAAGLVIWKWKFRGAAQM